jgi:asparagine synthase (glutamine-hydrolysing)
MNGICGWLGGHLSQADAEEVLDGMSSGFHFGFEQDRTFHSTATSSIAVVSERFGQAGKFCHERYLVCWEGKIYWNSEELSQKADESGHAETIAFAYQQLGLKTLDELLGVFAIALVDLAEQSLLLTVDRMGIRPLYYGRSGGGIVFGSTARSVNFHPSLRRSVDPQAVYNYLYSHMVPSPRAIYQGIQKLQPAEYVLFKDGELTKDFFWQPHYVDESDTPEKELIDEFNSLLRIAVRRSVEGAGKTGSFLSGGTDSSTIAGLMSELGPTDTYSIRFDAKGYDESDYAQIAAQHFGTRHHEYALTPRDVVQIVPKMAQAYDEPFGNASAVAAYYCARMAKEDGIDTLLGGDGGDEIFAGNARYAKQQLFEYYHAIPSNIRKGLLEPILFALPNKPILTIGKLQSYVQQAKVPLPDRLETYNFLHRTPPGEILHPDLLASVNINEPIELNRATYDRAQTQSQLNRMLYLDLKITLADNDLRKVTRVCELAGVDVDYPLLNEDIVTFSTQVPTSLKLKGQKLRFFFKKALEDFLPQKTIQKQKHGFGVPCGLWISQHSGMRELANDTLCSLRQRNYIAEPYLERLLQLHQTEHTHYYGVMVWVLMILEQWIQATAPTYE